MNEVDAGTLPSKEAKSLTVQDVADEYLRDREKAARRGDISNAHLIAETGACKRMPDSLKRMKLSALEDSGIIKEAILELRNRYSIRTVKAVRDTLSRVFDFAIESPRKYIPRNVLKDHPIRLGKSPKRQNMATHEEGVLLLQEAAKFQDYEKSLPRLNLYAILHLIIRRGCRPEEACGLQIEDIKRFDLPHPAVPDWRGTVTIRNTNTKDGGFKRRTKNEQIRTIPIGREILDAFDRVECYWQAYRDAEAPGHKSYERLAFLVRMRSRLQYYLKNPSAVQRRQHGPMFVNMRGGLLHASSLGNLVRELVRRIGAVQRDGEGRVLIGKNGKTKPRISLYSFRHKVATHNALNLPAHVGASATGHSERTFLSDYAHQSEGDLALIAKSFSNLDRELTEDEKPSHATILQRRLLKG
jgi:integrase